MSEVPVERYSVDLLIEHPVMPPETITAGVGLRPQYSWRQGERRKTPDGTLLPGARPDTMWRHVTSREGHRLFFEAVKDMLVQLRHHQDFLLRISSEGGHVTLIVNLPGDVNIGDVLDADSARLLSELRIGLGIEVFPRMKSP